MFNKTTKSVLFIALSSLFYLHAAQAESTLDAVIKAKKLRCAVVLDSPPSGFLTPENKPDGYDVAYCDDMAKSLGVTPEIVQTPASDRIPALVSKRVDIVVGSTTITPERAMTVAFTQPYVNYTITVMTRKDTGIKTYDDLEGKKLGAVTGSTFEQLFNKELQGRWKDTGTTYTGYGSDAEVFMALQQGKIDGILQASSVYNTLEKSGQFPTFTAAGLAPLSDMDGLAVRRGDPEFLNWARVFVWHQVVSGRYAELYKKYMGDGPLPSLTMAGVDF
ncbi:MAG: transporter substrate-binding domain-containing protein [Pantoea sp.]|uniref:transporter substrate-binding domain-containing protein n=1 Tax=Pantoea sp. TaxID=69393 RepID=UPI0023836053|nr:transporter substrate-binding domain-containing protein [Pantoea sp.]MDE1188029.1 transporter substrate-binding domain-containing protein [Pantoea sp.]